MERSMYEYTRVDPLGEYHLEDLLQAIEHEEVDITPEALEQLMQDFEESTREGFGPPTTKEIWT